MRALMQARINLVRVYVRSCKKRYKAAKAQPAEQPNSNKHFD